MHLAVYTTLPDKAAAQEMANGAVAKKLASCVQIEAIQSVYRWNATIENDAEVRLLFKTTQQKYAALAAHILALHPYDEPALWATRIETGSAGYLAWITAETSD